jgi:hypothetical protein
MNQARSISKDWKPNESGTLNIKRLEVQWTMNLLERKTAQRHYFITLSTDDYWACLIHWTSNLLILSVPDSLGFQSFDIERRLMKVIQEIRRVY